MKPPAASPTPLLARLEALADPARLRMLHLLSRAELAVSELADVLQMPQSSVSRHLKLLSDEGQAEGREEQRRHQRDQERDAALVFDGSKSLGQSSRHG